MGIIPNPWAPSRPDSQTLPTSGGVLQDAGTGYRMAIGTIAWEPIAWRFQPPAEDLNVTIARRRPATFAAIAAPMPTAPTVRPPLPGIGVPLPLGDAPAPELVTPVGRLRRCTFRRIDRVEPLPGRGTRTEYEVMCLYGAADEPLALGDISQARTVCDACTAAGIFRPDEA